MSESFEFDGYRITADYVTKLVIVTNILSKQSITLTFSTAIAICDVVQSVMQDNEDPRAKGEV